MTQSSLDALLTAIVPHVVFDGWSATAFEMARHDANLTEDEAAQAAPRGALDLAVAYHRRGDQAMRDAMANADLTDMRYRDKVAHAIWLRLQAIDDPEAVRRAMSLFALPHHSTEGTRLVWETADAIWDSLGDASDDVNWYTKRMTLSAVWSAVLLFWLGDQSENHSDTRAFIDRRIEDVMRIEKAKAGVRKSPLLRAAFSPLTALLSPIKAPSQTPRTDLPGGYRKP